jgi:hypothetical protein
MLVPALLAATIDGTAALRHASRLAALGPHPWGSALGRGAAQYVAAELGQSGLSEVRLEEFERGGTRGLNVVGVRPGPASGLIVVGAHHDTAPAAPGAYDDGGGVGVLIEVARAISKSQARGRTILFVSWDGEEGWARGTDRAGSRAFLDALGPRAREIAAALVVEMCGWRRGTPTLLPIAYADPDRPGQTVIAPAGLVRRAIDGARRGAPETALGDRYLSWLVQPAVRVGRVGLYGDDASFLERGIPALLASDSSFSAFYPWYHTPDDSADKLDAAALGRMGDAVLGAVRALESAPVDPPEPQWFAAFGFVFERTALLGAGLLSLLPLLAATRGGGVVSRGLRLVQALAFGALLWRQPVSAVWCFGLSNLVTPFARSRGARLGALGPFIGLVALLLVATLKKMVSGLWLAPWEMAAGGLVALLALVPSAASGPPAKAKGEPRGRGRRRGLPKR